MRQAAENFAFTFESFFTATATARDVRKLDGDVTLKASVATFSQPHGSHSAMADRGQQTVRADRVAGLRLARRQRGSLLQESFFSHCPLLVQQQFHQFSEIRAVLSKGGQPARTIFHAERQNLIEKRAGLLPLLRCQFRHRYLTMTSLVEVCCVSRCALSPNCVGRSAPIRLAWQRSQQ